MKIRLLSYFPFINNHIYYFGKCHHAFIIIDVKVSLCLNEKNRLYCTVRGGLVAAYCWIVNGSQYCHGQPDNIKIIDYQKVISQLFYNGNSTKLVGTFQCTIEDGMGRNVSSESLQINGNVLVCIKGHC